MKTAEVDLISPLSTFHYFLRRRFTKRPLTLKKTTAHKTSQHSVVEGELIDLSGIAERLDAEENLKLSYRFPIHSAGGQVSYETRVGKVLDVAEEAGLLYVSHEDDVIWVKLEEAIEVLSGDAA